jgi:hypothetical protein
MSLGARNSKRSRSQSPGLLFRGDRQGAEAPVLQDGGGAETRRAARNERKQKTAVLQGAARPQAVQRSRARETGRQKDGDRRSCRNRVAAAEFGRGRSDSAAKHNRLWCVYANTSLRGGATLERSRRLLGEGIRQSELKRRSKQVIMEGSMITCLLQIVDRLDQ